MKWDVWKPSGYQHWQDILWFLIWNFLQVEQPTLVNNYLLCCWPTFHNSIWKICPKFQVLISHFFKVNELYEHWAKIVQSENISIPIYIECDTMYWSIVCVQEFWYRVSGLDIQPEQSENNNAAHQNRFQVARLEKSLLFSSADWFNPWLSGQGK